MSKLLSRAALAVFVFVGGTTLSIWLDRLNVPTWVLALSWVGAFVFAALIAWWPRWKAGWVAFWHGTPVLEWREEMTPVYRKKYTNETIEIDRKSFQQCSFTNVTFSFRGIGPTSFIECQFSGMCVTQTDHPAAKAFVALTSGFVKQPNVDSFVYGVKSKSTGAIEVTTVVKESKKTQKLGDGSADETT
jgi:hypothetical protein